MVPTYIGKMLIYIFEGNHNKFVVQLMKAREPKRSVVFVLMLCISLY